MKAMRRLSVSNWRIRRDRDAPGESHSDFVLPGCGSGEQQIGGIGARDEEHHADGSEQDEEHSLA